MKMLVQFASLRPNPFRDFAVDPIDGPENDNAEVGHISAITKLKESIEEDGFWGGVVVRQSPSEPGAFEIAAGHHRIEAAKLAGINSAELAVLPLDDSGMVRVYGRENATQRGVMSSAVAGTVAAALRLVLKDASACSDEESSTGNFASSSHGGSQIGDKTIGRPAILHIIGNVPGMNDSKVKEQLAILKSSGDYRRIVEEAAEESRRIRADLERKADEARVAAEEAEARRAAAEEARKAAQKAAQEAREEAQKRAAEKRAADASVAERKAQEQANEGRRAAEKASAAVAVAEKAERKSEAAVEKTVDPKFDKNFDYQGVSKWLHNENQIRAFRKWCTGAGITPYLPVDGQEAVAKALAVHAAKHKIELSAAFINQKATELLISAKAVETKTLNKEEKAKLAAKDMADKVRAYQADFSRNCRGMISAGVQLAALSKKWPNNSAFPITAEFRTALRDVNTVIGQLLKEIPCE
jgi:hypothetical protein